MSKPEVENFSLLNRISVSVGILSDNPVSCSCWHVTQSWAGFCLWFPVSTSGLNGTPSYLAPLDFDFFIFSGAVLWPLS